jgi:aryl-alcohol dehydrogenase-like predicted oxidoreductase
VLNRIFGRTGLAVSEIGYGAWAIGGMWGPLDDRLALEALGRALEMGVTFIDTALAYGEGHSEKLVARAFRSAGRRVFTATKIPPKDYQWPARHDAPLRDVFPRDWIIRCTERSLTNLETDCIDLQQLHVWSPNWTNEPEWYEALRDLQKQGKIRHIGVSLNDHEPDTALELVRSGWVDSLQVIYNIFDQSPSKNLFPLAQQHSTAVIVRCPFDEGSLTGTFRENTVFPKGDWRKEYFCGERLIETVRRVETLSFLIRGETTTLAQAALRFCLSHPAVSTVIPGMRRPAHVEENCRVSDGKLLTTEELQRLTAHAWLRNFYD